MIRISNNHLLSNICIISITRDNMTQLSCPTMTNLFDCIFVTKIFNLYWVRK